MFDEMDIARNLKAKRKKMGISQEKAAELCDVSIKTFGELERGATNFTAATLKKVLPGMQMSWQELFADERHKS